MKNLKTGEITPPLPHDEYTKQADRLREEEAKKKPQPKVAAQAPVAATPQIAPQAPKK